MLAFTAILGAGIVAMLGLGLRMIYLGFKLEGKERVEFLAMGIGMIVLFGGFFIFQLWRIIERF